MKKKHILTILCIIVVQSLTAQGFKISGELRPRAEVRNGYKHLMLPGSEMAFFVSQRSRINFDYDKEKLKLKFTVQNIRVWGDAATLSLADKNGFAMHESWVNYQFSDIFGIKVGRQEISYDDQRIFGAVGWAQQARSHDAALLIFDLKTKGRIETGFAYNANRESLRHENYALNQYKSLQYLWYNVKLKDYMTLSVLALNNGLPYLKDSISQKIINSQTLGGRLTFKKKKLQSNGAFYYQTGNLPNIGSTGTIYQSAYYAALDFSYQITNHFFAGLGTEIISGSDLGSTKNQNNAFNPYYGTNHKFNGLMDYFYVGNHINSVGLIDIALPLKFKKDKSIISLTGHYFMAEGKIMDNGQTRSPDLGTEIDLTFAYTFNSTFKINAGYSQIFASQNLEFLTGGDRQLTNNWGWLMLTFKPVFLNHTEENKQ